MKPAKPKLDPDEVLEVAYWHLSRGYPQMDLASMHRVNIGRVSEACQAVEWVMQDPKAAYETMLAQRQRPATPETGGAP